MTVEWIAWQTWKQTSKRSKNYSEVTRDDRNMHLGLDYKSQGTVSWRALKHGFVLRYFILAVLSNALPVGVFCLPSLPTTQVVSTVGECGRTMREPALGRTWQVTVPCNGSVESILVWFVSSDETRSLSLPSYRKPWDGWGKRAKMRRQPRGWRDDQRCYPCCDNSCQKS